MAHFKSCCITPTLTLLLAIDSATAQTGRVAVTPARASLSAGQTRQFSAVITGPGSNAVNWTVEPAGWGTISPAGLYSSPTLIPRVITVRVKATSVANPASSDSADITLNPVSVNVTPANAALWAGQTQRFRVNVRNSANSGVTWSISPPGLGTISPAGIYTPPAVIPARTTVTVTAASVTDPTKTDIATVALAPLVIQVTPRAVTLTAGQTQRFNEQVRRTNNTSVIWTLNPLVGAISQAGIYSAPAIVGSQRSITLWATSAADSTKAASAVVTLISPVTVTPGTVSLLPGQTQQFAAAVLLNNTAVTWSLSPPLGTMSPAGFYTAPAAVSSTQNVEVIATSAQNPAQKASAVITLNPPVSVSVSPATATVRQGGSQSFAALVTNAANTGVVWSLVPAGLGTVSSAGLYTAPAFLPAQSTVSVVAISVADPSRNAAANVTLLPPVTVSVTPSPVTLTPGQTQAFAANVQYSSNPAVTWSINPVGVGIITAAGVYAPPSSLAGSASVTVTATSVADPSRSGAATVTVQGSSGNLVTRIAPAVLNLLVGESHSIQALNAAGQQVSSGGWLTSNSNVVSLSTDTDQPVLTAVAPGVATISVGSATAEVAVLAGGDLPPGTVRWSVPGSVVSIIRAIPSVTGVADVFALQADGIVQALTRDGTVAWTANAGRFFSRPPVVIADSQGGAVVRNEAGVFRFDGLTGAASPLYSSPAEYIIEGTVNVLPDGTILAIESNIDDNSQRLGERRAIGIDPATGARKFVVPLQDYEPFYGNSGPANPCNGGPTTIYIAGGVGGIIVAGDGFAYVPYANPEIFIDCASHGSYINVSHLRLLRLASDGSFTKISVKDAQAPSGAFAWATGFAGHAITNADLGTLLSWQVWFSGDGPSPNAAGLVQYGTAVTAGTSLSIVSSSPALAGQAGALEPALQLQDGSFAGKVEMEDGSSRMIGLSKTGAVLWSVPEETPFAATDDGGLVAESGSTYSQSGAPTGQITPLITSWTGNAYRIGSVEQIAGGAIRFGISWLPFQANTANFPRDADTNAKVNKILSPAFWTKFARTHCHALFANQLSLMLNYNLKQVQDKQARTNFYDVSKSDGGQLTLKVVTGGEFGSNVTLVERLGTSVASAENYGFDRTTAVLLKPEVLAEAKPQYTLVHELVLHAYRGFSDGEVFGNTFFTAQKLWRPAGATATLNISTWLGTDCTCTPGDPSTPACVANSSATW